MAQEISDNHAQDRIAEELQAFVVLPDTDSRHTRSGFVKQSLTEQINMADSESENILEV